MSYKTDVKFFQSFCRRYVNRIVKLHFSDLASINDGDLRIDSPRQATQKLLLHKADDPLLLTVGRLLFWWLETKGLMDEYIYAIPSTDFHETNKFLPQITITWRESIEDARSANRYATKARYTVRWRGDYATTNDINQIRRKVNLIFNNPTRHSFYKGREKYSYYDLEKGYRLIVTARDETEAKDVINKLLEIQDDNPLNESLLGKNTKDRNWDTNEIIRVNGQNYKKPTERPIGKVWFDKAEFKVHGMTHDILLTNRLGVNLPASTS